MAGKFSRPKRRGAPSATLLLATTLVVMTASFAVLALSLVGAVAPSPSDEETKPQRVSSNQSTLSLVDVLVTVSKIEAGTALEPALFRKESRPELVVGPNHIREFSQVKGAYAASFIAAGQPLLTEYVTLKRPVNSITANIPDGFRAVTIAVDETTSVEGWARPGAKVDVVVASVIAGKPALSIIVQNALVLSNGAGSGDSGRSASGSSNFVTIMVTIEEAKRIQLAAASGKVSLTLRGDDDSIETAVNSTLTLDSVLGSTNTRPNAVLPTEGTVRIDGMEYVVVEGKLVTKEQAAELLGVQQPQ